MVVQEPVVISDAALCRRLTAGDQEALAALYDRYGGLAFGVALRVTGSRETAEDVVQLSFMKLWQSAQLYVDDRGGFRSWFLRLVRNIAIDRLRKEASLHRVSEGLSMEMRSASPAPDPLEVVLRRATSGVVRSAVERLAPGQREVIERAYYGGRSMPEIAGSAALPVSTVKGRMRMALRTLRGELLSLQE